MNNASRKTAASVPGPRGVCAMAISAATLKVAQAATDAAKIIARYRDSCAGNCRQGAAGAGDLRHHRRAAVHHGCPAAVGDHILRAADHDHSADCPRQTLRGVNGIAGGRGGINAFR